MSEPNRLILLKLDESAELLVEAYQRIDALSALLAEGAVMAGYTEHRGLLEWRVRAYRALEN